MTGEIVKYELSTDKKGLLAFFKNGQFFHVHSDEMDDLQQWIHGLLLFVSESKIEIPSQI